MREDNAVDRQEICFNYPEDQHFLFDRYKGAYWEETSTLIVSDVHLGKAGHFRKHGIPIPSSIHISDLHRLDALVKKYNPARLIFLGDLFHSDHNEEWDSFSDWSERNGDISQLLIKGNHDILEKSVYERTKVEILDELNEGPFHFTHEPKKTEKHNIAGHIHPGIRLKGPARQGISLPCFHVLGGQTIFPAFGNFTGSYKVKPRKGDHIFAITTDAIIALMV